VDKARNRERVMLSGEYSGKGEGKRRKREGGAGEEGREMKEGETGGEMNKRKGGREAGGRIEKEERG